MGQKEESMESWDSLREEAFEGPRKETEAELGHHEESERA